MPGGLFDPMSFMPQDPRAGLFARLSGMAGFQPTPQSVLPGQPAQPGMEAMGASGIIPPQPGAPPGLPQPQGGQSQPGMLDQMAGGLSGLYNLAPALMAMGGATMRGGLGAGLMAGAGPMAQMQQQSMQRATLAATYKALTDAGVPAPQAQAMAMNPELLKTMAPQFMAKPAFGEIGVDQFGNKKMGWIDSNNRTVTDAAGNPVQGGGAGTDATDPDWFAKLDPFIQSSIKSYINGDTMPTGNPRGMPAAKIKAMAQQYGNEIGVPATDEAFYQKKQLLTQLGSTQPGGAGGQLNNGSTAFNHLDALAKSAVALDNSSGFGWAPIASLLNSARGLTTEQSAKMQAVKDNAQHYGQEITKFYAGSPGGEAERDRFLTSVDAAKSPAELAAVIEKESQLIPGRFDQISSQINSVMGTNVPGSPQNVQAKRALDMIDATKKTSASIAQSVAVLRQQAKGGAQAPQAPAATGGAAPTITHGKTGQKMILQNGQWVPIGATQAPGIEQLL